MDLFTIIEKIGETIDLIGVLVILLGAIGATVFYLKRGMRGRIGSHENYKLYRQGIGRAILLGLEFLVAGDIIRSVAGEPTFTTIGVLALIVLIRSFLAIEFEMEVNGRWPWQAATKKRRK